ncbi:MAG: hypothetical protein QOH04_63 [Sphingomonadales bacterium]|jgi:hypothetical protein|nr:hypothetical protein [Sphingomonadales bacterium]
MEAVLTFAAIIAAAMTFLWLVGQFDQWVQKTRGVGAIGGRRADGMVAKIGVAIRWSFCLSFICSRAVAHIRWMAASVACDAEKGPPSTKKRQEWLTQNST